MANKEFDLSVLENIATFSTPLKECLDYAAIFDLIKEDSDTATLTDNGTEDKNSPFTSPISTKTKGSESCSSESMFKSLSRKRKCSRLKSPGLSLNAQKQRSFEYQTYRARLTRARSLGTIKPKRSFINRDRRSSIYHSETSTTFNSGDDTIAERPQKILKHAIPAQHTEQNGTEYIVLPRIKNEVIDAEAEDENRKSRNKDDSTSLGTDEPSDLVTDNESVVESSQSTQPSSELRLSLNRGRKPMEITPTKKEVVKKELDNDLVESEEDNEHFSLSISPGSKSEASMGAKEASASPPRSRKRKAVCRVSPLKGLTTKLDSSTDETAASSTQQRIRKISLTSPLKGLSQELENCMRNDNYIEMCDSETESMSFTFETIQLLNEYDDSNDQTNNKILNNIFSSPARLSEVDTPTIPDNVTSSSVQPVEDPLCIDTSKDVPVSMTENPEMNETLIADDSDSDANSLSTRNERRKSTKKTPTRANRNSTAADTSTNRKRRSTRLETKEPVNTCPWRSDDSQSESQRSAEIEEEIRAAEEKSALSAETIRKLYDLVIRLRHEVLPQHKIESSAGSSTLSYKQQNTFLEYAPLNKSTYSPAEDQIIHENWRTFCEDHNWEPTNYRPFLHLKHGKQLIMSSLEERRKFVQYLANRLPNRPLCSVYARFRILYNKYYAAGLRYTHTEDAKIIAYMKCHAGATPEQKCSELAKVMNRSRVSIWKRYSKLTKKNCPTEKKKRVLTKVEWDLSLVEDFITRLLDVTLSDELIELKDAFLPKVVWLKMEEKMRIRFDIMQRFWDCKLHLQLFAPKKISINEIKIRLIEYMHMKGISNSHEIKWNAIVKYFDGCTIPFLRYVFNHLTMKASQVLQTRNFREIMQWLHGKKISELKCTLADKCLPRITYVDKKAELVTEDLGRIRLLSEKSDDSAF